MAATGSMQEIKERKENKEGKELKSKVNIQKVTGVQGLHKTLENYLRKPKLSDQQRAAEGQEVGHEVSEHVQ